MKRAAFAGLASCLGVLLVIACGDDEAPPIDNRATTDAAGPDGNTAPDGPTPDGDAGMDADASPFVVPASKAVPLSATGPDQLHSVAPGPDGTFYAAGFAAPSFAGDRKIVVVKLTATGAVDATWASQGVASTDVTFAGASDEIDIAVQPSGKLVVSATIPNNIISSDTDVGILRLLANGTVDDEFGVDGLLRVDLSTTVPNGAKDQARAIAIGSDGSIFVHANARATGLRTDSDFVVAKFGVDGQAVTFGTSGKYVHDIDQTSAVPRGLLILPDGSILAGGAATVPPLTGLQPILYKLSATGALVDSFVEQVLDLYAEAYNFALHGTHVVAGGYGRSTGDSNDWFATRFDVATLDRDRMFGGAPNGAVIIDVAGAQASDNCRNTLGLPNDKTLLLGSTGTAAGNLMEAAFAVLDANGKLDQAYGSGVHSFNFGGTGNDQLWGAAVSGSNVMMVGFRAVVPQTEAANDDSFVMVIPLR